MPLLAMLALTIILTTATITGMLKLSAINKQQERHVIGKEEIAAYKDMLETLNDDELRREVRSVVREVKSGSRHVIFMKLAEGECSSRGKAKIFQEGYRSAM